MTKPRALLAIGYWSNRARRDLPTPFPLVDTAWSIEERRRVAEYLRAGEVLEVWRGYSNCRFHDCQTPRDQMGHRDLTDGVWVWPEGLHHYVDIHGVRLPWDFERRALEGVPKLAVPPRNDPRHPPTDDAPWKAWAARFTTGASTEDRARAYAHLWTTDIDRYGLVETGGSGAGWSLFDLVTRGVVLIDEEDDAVLAEIGERLRAAGVRRISPGEMTAHADADDLERDRQWYEALGEELGPAACSTAGCERLHVAQSVKCRQHHYEMVHGRPCPF